MPILKFMHFICYRDGTLLHGKQSVEMSIDPYIKSVPRYIYSELQRRNGWTKHINLLIFVSVSVCVSECECMNCTVIFPMCVCEIQLDVIQLNNKMEKNRTTTNTLINFFFFLFGVSITIVTIERVTIYTQCYNRIHLSLVISQLCFASFWVRTMPHDWIQFGF